MGVSILLFRYYRFQFSIYSNERRLTINNKFTKRVPFFYYTKVRKHFTDSTALEVGLELYGRLVNNLRFAEDINLMSETTVGLQKITDQISQQWERFGLVINSGKTKVMTISKEQHDLQLSVNGTQLEQVKEFVYLGGQIAQDGRCESDIKRRIGLTWAVFNKLTNIWNCHNHDKGDQVTGVRINGDFCTDVWLGALDDEKGRWAEGSGRRDVLDPKIYSEYPDYSTSETTTSESEQECRWRQSTE